MASDLKTDEVGGNTNLDMILSERERQLLEQERIINAELDAKIQANHDKFPKAIYFIVPNEFCERFCYYGIKNLLYRYMITGFGFEEYFAKSQTHLFNGLVYFFPVVGASISDSFLGKYHTIVYFSLVYLIGNALLAIFSINNLANKFGEYQYWAFILPALLIAIGSGGIKPCVVSHGGDQFLKSQEKLLDRFFAIFYISINVGSLIAQYLTPYLKEYVECFGSKCYFIAFGIPTIVFGIALATFVFGFRYYRIVPPTKKFMPLVATKVAISARSKYNRASKEEKDVKGHWLNFALEEYGSEMVEETRLFGKVIVMFIPIIFWWMLYDQNGTEWQKNYDVMDHNFLYFIPLPTEASSNINSILIILFVPLLTYVIYPFLEKRGIKMTLLNRMIWGYFLVICAFILSTCLQYHVDNYAHNLVVDAEKNYVSCNGCVNGTIQLPQWILLSLGEAMLSPTGNHFAYTQVGRQMRASSTSIFLLTVAFGNYVVLGLEIGLHAGGVSPANAQWTFIAISSVFFLLFIYLAKYWYVTKEDEDAAKEIAEQNEFIIKE